MVGNVTGVSLLETVGVVGPQAGPETAPAQNFAVVMQQTSEQNGTPLPKPVGDKQAENGSDQKNATVAGQKDAGSAAKEAAGAEKDCGAPPAQRGTGATNFTGKGGFAGVTGRMIVAPQPEMQDDSLVANVAAPGGKTEQTTLPQTVALPQQVVVKAPVAPATPAQAKADAAGLPAGTPPPQEAAAPVLKSVDGVNAAKLEAGARSVGKETPNVWAKPASKQNDGKGDMTLTALIPQGTPEVPQSVVAAPDVSASTVIVASPVMLASNEGNAAANRVNSATIAAAEEMASARLPVAPKVQGTQLQATGPKQALTVPNVAGAMPAVAESIAPKVKALVPVAGKPILAKDAQDAKDKPLFGLQEYQAIQAQAVPVMPSQQGMAPSASVPDVAGIAAQSVTGTAAAGGVAGAAKPGVQGGRNGVVAVNNGAVPVFEGAGSTQEPKLVSAVEVPSASTAPAVQTAGPSDSRAMTAVSAPKAALRPGERAAAVAGNLQPVEVQLASPLKTAVPDELPGVTATTRDKAVDAVAPSVSTQPAVLHADPGTSTATVTVSAMAAPLPHAPVVGGVTASDPAGVASAMRAEAGGGGNGTGAGGSLPHTTLSATPNSLEVGVSSGTHGWLKIRAELNAAGEVNASLTGANPAAASRLRSELPALSSYLQSEKVSMGVLDVRSALHTTAFETSSSFSHAGGSSSAGTTVGADAGANGGRAQHQQAQQGAEPVPVLNGRRNIDEVSLGRISDAATYGISMELDGSEGSSSVGYGAGGSWLNVRV